MELSEAGALAFLAWWVDMYNYVEATGETDLVFEHSEPGCTFCQNFVDRVNPVYEAGGRIEREAPTAFETPSVETLADRYAVMTLEVSSGDTRTFDASGDLVRTAPGDDPPFRAVVGLQWATQEWLLADIGIEGE